MEDSYEDEDEDEEEEDEDELEDGMRDDDEEEDEDYDRYGPIRHQQHRRGHSQQRSTGNSGVEAPWVSNNCNFFKVTCFFLIVSPCFISA